MDEIDRIIDCIYESVTDDGAWPHALTSLCKITNAHHSIGMVRNTARETTPLLASAGVDAVHLARFGDRAGEIDGQTRGFPPGVAFDRAMILPDREVRGTDFYNDIIRPMEGFRSLMSVPFRRAHHMSFVSVCRPPGAADFGRQERAVLERITPHASRAFRARVEIEGATTRAAVALAVHDRLDIAIAVVDADLRAVVLNRAAEAIVARGDGLVRSRNLLEAGKPNEIRLLRRLVRQAISDDPRAPVPHVIRLTRPAGAGPPWCVLVRRLDWSEGPSTREPLAALVLESPTSDPENVAPTLIAAFGLTRREAALAALLARGDDVAEAASRLGITTGTARNYLKSAFLKTKTRRQAELVVLILRMTRF